MAQTATKEKVVLAYSGGLDTSVCLKWLQVEKGLGVMDSTAAAMCRDNNIPVLVFSLSNPDNILAAISGEQIGTIVKEEKADE